MERIIGCIVLALLVCAQGGSQGGNKISKLKNKNTFATDECWQKGGLGIVNTHLYIEVKSDRNRLRTDGPDWTGQSASTPEAVIFYENKIWSPQGLPNGFDLTRAIVISFEADKIRFFDFGEMTGGYYKRMKPD
jgi:hypothetical protein